MKRPELVKKLMNEGLSEKLLSNLTDKQLKDIGITRGEAKARFFEV